MAWVAEPLFVNSLHKPSLHLLQCLQYFSLNYLVAFNLPAPVLNHQSDIDSGFLKVGKKFGLLQTVSFTDSPFQKVSIHRPLK